MSILYFKGSWWGQSIAFINIMDAEMINKIKKASVGGMPGLSKTILDFQNQGYKENFIPDYDHFYYGPDKIELYPHDIFFDEVIRFENLSDPDDQSILYAISSPSKNVKGIYVESYGVGHDDLSPSMIERMKFCHDLKRGTLHY